MDPRDAELQPEDPDFLPAEAELEGADFAAEMKLLLDRVQAARLSGA